MYIDKIVQTNMDTPQMIPPEIPKFKGFNMISSLIKLTSCQTECSSEKSQKMRAKRKEL